MNSQEISDKAKILRGSIEMLYQKAVDELEMAATAAVDDSCYPGDTLSPSMVRLRDALRAMDLVGEMRV